MKIQRDRTRNKPKLTRLQIDLTRVTRHKPKKNKTQDIYKKQTNRTRLKTEIKRLETEIPRLKTKITRFSETQDT